MAVSDTPRRRATMAVWSMNLSAPDSKRKRAVTNAAALYRMVFMSQPMVECRRSDLGGVTGGRFLRYGKLELNFSLSRVSGEKI